MWLKMNVQFVTLWVLTPCILVGGFQRIHWREQVAPITSHLPIKLHEVIIQKTEF
jgi:hypothetical protein